MRLIDADAFIDYLGLDVENSREDNLGEIVTLEDFDRQPTYYDADKVVECLEILSDSADDKIMNEYGSEQYWDGFGDGVDEAIKIVKSGGIK